MEFKSTHNLSFEMADWEYSHAYKRFRIGTCEGLWCCENGSYCILAIDNKSPGNGHFEDVLEWFINSCKRDKKTLKILEVINQKFKTHLINKRGFRDIGKDNLELIFNN